MWWLYKCECVSNTGVNITVWASGPSSIRDGSGQCTNISYLCAHVGYFYTALPPCLYQGLNVEG